MNFARTKMSSKAFFALFLLCILNLVTGSTFVPRMRKYQTSIKNDQMTSDRVLINDGEKEREKKEEKEEKLFSSSFLPEEERREKRNSLKHERRKKKKLFYFSSLPYLHLHPHHHHHFVYHQHPYLHQTASFSSSPSFPVTRSKREIQENVREKSRKNERKEKRRKNHSKHTNYRNYEIDTHTNHKYSNHGVHNHKFFPRVSNYKRHKLHIVSPSSVNNYNNSNSMLLVSPSVNDGKNFETLVTPSMLVSTCPSVCTCRWKSGKKSVNCDNGSGNVPMVQLLQGIDSETQILDLSKNSFFHNSLTNRFFYNLNLNNLQRIYLSKCRIQSMEEETFYSLTNLIELDLSNNDLIQVPKETLKNAPSLRRLSLSGNPIQIIPEGAFSELSNLYLLDLSSCLLNVIQPYGFHGLITLRVLRLNDNKLRTLNGRILDTMIELQELDLQGNPWKCDCGLRELREKMIKRRIPLSFDPKCSLEEEEVLEPSSNIRQSSRILEGNWKRLGNYPWSNLSLDEFSCIPKIVHPHHFPNDGDKDGDYNNQHILMNGYSGEDISLECIIQSIPLPYIEWFKTVKNNSSSTPGGSHSSNYSPVSPSVNYNSYPNIQSKHMLHSQINEVLITNMSLMSFGRQMYVIREEINSIQSIKVSKLLIMNPLTKDSGRYWCKGTNKAGNVIQRFDIQISGNKKSNSYPQMALSAYTSEQLAGFILGMLLITIGLIVIVIYIVIKYKKIDTPLLRTICNSNTNPGNNNGGNCVVIKNNGTAPSVNSNSNHANSRGQLAPPRPPMVTTSGGNSPQPDLVPQRNVSTNSSVKEWMVKKEVLNRNSSKGNVLERDKYKNKVLEQNTSIDFISRRIDHQDNQEEEEREEEERRKKGRRRKRQEVDERRKKEEERRRENVLEQSCSNSYYSSTSNISSGDSSDETIREEREEERRRSKDNNLHPLPSSENNFSPIFSNSTLLMKELNEKIRNRNNLSTNEMSTVEMSNQKVTTIDRYNNRRINPIRRSSLTDLSAPPNGYNDESRVMTPSGNNFNKNFDTAMMMMSPASSPIPPFSTDRLASVNRRRQSAPLSDAIYGNVDFRRQMALETKFQNGGMNCDKERLSLLIRKQQQLTNAVTRLNSRQIDSPTNFLSTK